VKPVKSDIRSWLFPAILLIGWMGFGLDSTGYAQKAEPIAATAAERTTLGNMHGELGLSFEPNEGQADPSTKFLSRGRGYLLFLSGDESLLVLHRGRDALPQRQTRSEARSFGNREDLVSSGGSSLAFFPWRGHSDNRTVSPLEGGAIIRMRLVGGDRHTAIVGSDELPGRSNYFEGSDPKGWRTNIPNYAKVRLQEVYPGIDLVYYGHEGRLEYDFVVARGANPSRIQLQFDGTDSVKIDSSGNLVVGARGGEVRFRRPMIYQSPGDSSETRPEPARRINGKFVLQGKRTVRFRVGRFDRHRPLVIDPALVYSTYFGGSGDESGNAIATDSSGNVYVTGRTDSVNFPVVAAFQKTYGGQSTGCEPSANCGDVFVTKLNPSGTAIVYSTYIGGSDDEWGSGIAIDSAGDAYVTGPTDSLNFPTVRPLQATCKGCNPYTQTMDAFVAELNSTGSALVYSTYLGGSTNNTANCIAIDSGGSAYVGGWTGSSDFPVTPGAFQTSITSDNSDAFVAKISPGGTALAYSTYLGGGAAVKGGITGIAVDNSGSTYVTGSTGSPDFPTTAGTFSIPFGLGAPPGSAPYSSYLTKLNSAGSALLYSLLLPGSSAQVAVDPLGRAYVAGEAGQFFPTTPGALNDACDAGSFLSKFAPDGSNLIFSDYFCSEADSQPSAYGFSYGPPGALALDSSGYVYMGGTTGATGFPATAGAFQTQLANGCCLFDGFLVKVTPDGSALAYSTYLGGSGSEGVYGVSVDSSGNAYLTGYTNSTNFPVANPIQGSLSGPSDAFIAEMSTTSAGSLSAWPAVLNFGDQGVSTGSSPLTVTLANIGISSIFISSIGVAGNFSQTNNCSSGLAPSIRCSVAVVFNPQTAGTLEGTLTITPYGSESPISVQLGGNGVNGPVAVFNPTNPFWTSQPMGFTSPPLTITVTNAGNSELTVTGVSGTAGPEGIFTPTSNNCVATPPQSSCSVQVTFEPGSSFGGDPVYGTLTFQDNAGTGSQSLQLIGSGGADGVTFSSPGLKFADESVGSPSAAQSVFLINGLSTSITLAGITPPSDFSQSNNCGTTLASGAYCTFSVKFNPATSGVRLERLTVSDSGAGSPHILYLLGAGVAAEVGLSASELSFEDQLVGSTSPAQVVILTNTGTAALAITSVVPSGPFTQSNTCGTSLAAGASCTVSVSFSPTSPGLQQGGLTITDNSSPATQIVTLIGIAVLSSSQLSVSPASLSFGNVSLGSSAVQTVTLTNSGPDAVTISQDYVTGTGFSVSGLSQPQTVAAGQSATLTVTFAPTVPGSATGTLAVVSNATNSPATVSLSGTLLAWQQVPGLLTQIALGSAGSVWGINSAGQIFNFNTGTQTWNQIPGQLAQIAVASDGAVWGINASQQVFRFNPQTQGWDQIPGTFAQIAVGSAGVVWAINAAQQIFRFDPGTQGWDQIPGALTQIAVGADGSVWGLNAQQQIFYFDPQTQGWDQIPGLLTQIAVGSANAVWGLNAQQQIYHYNPQTQDWDQIPGLLTQITVGANGAVWGINAAQQIFTFNAQPQTWEQIPGALAQIAVGADGSVWGINAQQQIFELNVPPSVTRTWGQIPGLLAQLAVGVDGSVWGINAAQQIYIFNAITQSWDQVPGLPTQIAVGFGGAVWGINAAQQIYRFNAQIQSWDHIPGALAQIAVGSANAVWGINAQLQIYRYNPQTQGWEQIPGALAQIAVGADGAVWGINAAQEIFTFNPQTQSWNQIPGLLTHIAVGSANAVWGINAQQQIYRYNSQTQGWDQIPGQLTQIAVAYDGVAWGINSAQEIFTFDTQTQGWDQVPGLLAQIAVGSDGVVWGLNSSGQIFQVQ
jgi:hypothetical protein